MRGSYIVLNFSFVNIPIDVLKHWLVVLYQDVMKIQPKGVHKRYSYEAMNCFRILRIIIFYYKMRGSYIVLNFSFVNIPIDVLKQKK